MTLRELYIDLATNYGEEFRNNKVIITNIGGTVYYKGKAKYTPKNLLDKRLLITSSDKSGNTIFKIEI